MEDRLFVTALGAALRRQAAIRAGRVAKLVEMREAATAAKKTAARAAKKTAKAAAAERRRRRSVVGCARPKGNEEVHMHGRICEHARVGAQVLQGVRRQWHLRARSGGGATDATKDCGGSGFCEHGRQRSKCKDCRCMREGRCGCAREGSGCARGSAAALEGEMAAAECIECTVGKLEQTLTSECTAAPGAM
jgi:hypothetical protein